MTSCAGAGKTAQRCPNVLMLSTSRIGQNGAVRVYLVVSSAADVIGRRTVC
jgi:hypothetical protein